MPVHDRRCTPNKAWDFHPGTNTTGGAFGEFKCQPNICSNQNNDTFNHAETILFKDIFLIYNLLTAEWIAQLHNLAQLHYKG